MHTVLQMLADITYYTVSEKKPEWVDIVTSMHILSSRNERSFKMPLHIPSDLCY